MGPRLSRLVCINAIGSLVTCAAHAQECRPLSEGTLKKIADYVTERFDVSPDVLVEDEGTVSDTCYQPRFHTAPLDRPDLTVDFGRHGGTFGPGSSYRQ